MNSSLKNPLGLRNGRLVTVSEVPKGLACDCICPNEACRARFVAKHCGSGRQSHFAHYKADDCGASYESAIHLFAKEFLHKSRTILLPELKVTCKYGRRFTDNTEIAEMIEERRILEFEEARLEVWLEGRVPDVILYRGDRQILVEIVVTHDITPEKHEWIRSHAFATLRVDLTRVNPASALEEIPHILQTGRAMYWGGEVSWFHHPAREDAQARVDQEFMLDYERHRAAEIERAKPPVALPRTFPWSPAPPPKPRQLHLFD